MPGEPYTMHKRGTKYPGNQASDNQALPQFQNIQQSRQTDTVTLAEAAAQLHQVEQFIKAAAVTDGQRIEQVQSAITNGNYGPDPAEVAGKMLNFESALNTARARG
jgi:negative regulator of flagellin synthesis FlgM